MANKLSDLNNHLFDQLKRLGVADLTPEQLEQECNRTTAIVAIADQISETANLQLKAATLFANHGMSVLPMLPLIGKSE